MDANLPAAKVPRCDYCQKTFSSERRRSQHTRQLQHWVAGGPPPTRTTQPPANLYRCGDCQKTFSSNAGLDQHARTVHTLAAVVAVQPPPTQTTQRPANLYRCGDCQKTFSSNAGLNQHARTVHTLAAVVAVQSPPTQTTQRPAKLHPCGKCQRKFSSKGERKRHDRTVHKGAARPRRTQATRPASKTQENPRSAPPRKKRAGAGQHCDARLETMQTKPIAAYPTQCAVCDRLVPSPHWIAHVSDAFHAKSQREADVTLKRRMSGLSRGRCRLTGSRSISARPRGPRR
ncbi:hypothetical protein DFH09DRAFT_369954 [Mycena vulgaris]|nr:hypothetical protein DFH09DRAFT_369954 [Mycena vulgaris]